MKWMGALEFGTSLWFRLEPVPTGKELDVGQEKRGNRETEGIWFANSC